MKRELKKIPKFQNEDAEFKFWSTHDVTDYVDISKGKRVVFPNLKPTSQPILIRLPLHLLNHLKMLAHKNDIPYQSLMKLFLTERVNKELHSGIHKIR